MEAIYGLALLSASVLLLFFAAKFRNAPSASKWSRSSLILFTVLFATVIGCIVAFAMLLDFGINISARTFGVLETGLLVVTVGASWFGWRAIKAMPMAASTPPAGTA